MLLELKKIIIQVSEIHVQGNEKAPWVRVLVTKPEWEQQKSTW